jgi:Flp pilus assembly protein TadB
MKNFHYGHCLIGVALAVIVLIALGVSAGTLGFLAVVLLCPLMMFVMMRMMMNDNKTDTADHDQPVDQHQHP